MSASYFMRFGLALIGAGLLASPASSQDHGMPLVISRGCPVSLTVTVVGRGKVQQLASLRESAGMQIAVDVSGTEVDQIRSMTLSAYGHNFTKVPARLRTKLFQLDRTALQGQSFHGSTSVDWTNVEAVRIETIDYFHQSPWHPSAEQFCAAAPKTTPLQERL